MRSKTPIAQIERREEKLRGKGYEVNYFARKHGLPKLQAQAIIDEIGNDRDKLNAAAQAVKR